jgi:hypothetical protein
MLSFSES